MTTNKEGTCSKTCTGGWLNKRVLGLTLGVWLILFAVLPHSARGISWTARSVAGLWDSGAKVVGVERPHRVKADRGERPTRRPATSFNRTSE